MDTEGLLAPTSLAAARRHFEALRPTAEELVSELAGLLTGEAVDDDRAVETAQEIVFAGVLTIHTGSRAEFEEWVADHDEPVTEFGSEHVANVAWHPGPDEIVAATYEDQRRAAIQTLRRQAMGHCYREAF